MRGSRVARMLLLVSFAEGEDGRRLMEWAGSGRVAGAVETWRREDGLRDAVMRGVPGMVGVVGVGVGEDDESGLLTLKVDEDAVAWWWM